MHWFLLLSYIPSKKSPAFKIILIPSFIQNSYILLRISGSSSICPRWVSDIKTAFRLVTLSGTIKLDVNNAAEMDMLGTIHTMIASGTIAQFNNKSIQFDLLSAYTSDTLTYTTYTANVNVSFSDLGGAAEDEAEFSFEMTLIGTATTS